jgi:hypothetical protein
VTTITGINDVVRTLANFKALASVWVEFDMEAPPTRSDPSLVFYADALAMKLTSRQAGKWLDTRAGMEGEAKLVHYCFHMFQTIIHNHVCQSSNVIDHAYILVDDWSVMRCPIPYFWSYGGS